MRKRNALVGGLALAVCGGLACANTVEMSKIVCYGELTDEGGGIYSGLVPVVEDGGFDVYALNGGTAWFGDGSPPDDIWTPATIKYHDAWPTWDPDTPDWDHYALKLWNDGGTQKWALQYFHSVPSVPAADPISGVMDWMRMYAVETGTGAYYSSEQGTAEIPGGAAQYGGGAGAWDMDWSWGSEAVPLEMPGFAVEITGPDGEGKYDVVLTPKANTAASATLEFEGELSSKGPALTGTIDMGPGSYYVPGGDGAHIGVDGGFDVYAQAGGVAYVEGYYGSGPWNDGNVLDTYVVGADNDAYPGEFTGMPWGTWYDPDCADYYNYELVLGETTWAVRYKGTAHTPLAGTMDWDTMYASEDDGYWNANWTWGDDEIPLELSGFYLNIEETKGTYHVTMTPSVSPTVALNADVCNTDGKVEVTIDMPAMAKQIAGGQFFLTYDNTVLTYFDHEAGDYPFDTIVYWNLNESAGTIAISVGDWEGGYTNQASRMATLTFTIIDELCSEADLVEFDLGHAPPSMLTEPGGIPVYPYLSDLYAISTDLTSPVIDTAASDMFVECDGAGNVAALDAWLLDNGGADASDDCGVTWSDDYLPSNFQEVCCETGYVTVTFRATDPCDLYAETTATFYIEDNTPPTIENCGSYPNLSMDADAGLCTAYVSWDAAVVSDVCCDAIAVEYEIDLDDDAVVDETITATNYTFPGGTHRVTIVATDGCDNYSTCDFTVTVSDYSQLVIDIDLQSVFTSFDRCITFDLRGVGGTADATVSEVISFTAGQLPAPVTVLVPCGDYDCLLVSDHLHTLKRNAADFALAGTKWSASVIGIDSLLGGNLNGDLYGGYIDILDFGIFVGEFGNNYGTPNTTCATPAPHADISGDGLVTTADFTFISGNFLEQNESCPVFLNPGAKPATSLQDAGPITRITVSDLVRLGMGDLAVADLNHDGWLDGLDIAAFLDGARPTRSRQIR